MCTWCEHSIGMVRTSNLIVLTSFGTPDVTTRNESLNIVFVDSRQFSYMALYKYKKLHSIYFTRIICIYVGRVINIYYYVRMYKSVDPRLSNFSYGANIKL